jgi:hypothetical protein
MDEIKTVPAQFAEQVVRRCGSNGGQAVSEAVAEIVASTPALNGRGRLLQLYGLGERARMWCADALDVIGDSTRADLTRRMSIIDATAAAVADHNLGAYAELIGDFPAPPTREKSQAAAKIVLDETRGLLQVLASGEPGLHEADWDQCTPAVEHAAAALTAAWRGGIVTNVRRETLTAIHAMDTPTVRLAV